MGYYEIFGDPSLGPDVATSGKLVPVTTSDINAPPGVRRVVVKSDFANNRILACVQTDRGNFKVSLPLSAVRVIFENVLVENGVDVSDSMGAPDSLGDLYDNFGFSLGSAFKSVKKATQGAVKAVAKTAVKSVTTPIKHTVKAVTDPKAALRSVTKAVSNPKATLKGVVKSQGAHIAEMAKYAKAPIEAQRQAMGSIPGIGPQLVKVHDKADALTKKAIRSKYTGAALMATAAVVPAVGGPALAAWTIANRIDAIQQAAERAAAAAKAGNLKALGQAALDAGTAQIPAVKRLQAAVPTSAQGLVRGALRNLPKGASVAAAARHGLGQLSPQQMALLKRYNVRVSARLPRGVY